MNRLLPALAALLLTCLAGCSPETQTPAASPGSLLITNASIIDGTGAPAFHGALRVQQGRVKEVGSLRPLPGEPVLDAGGMTLAPGFIDTHSHADQDIFDLPDALPATSQGITTAVVGQDGESAFPLAEFFARLEQAPAALNLAAFTGHGTLRARAMGQDYRRHANDDELSQMAAWLEQDLAAGSLGLATGLEYDPGIYSSRDEVLALARVAAARDGRYISHIRSEDRWLEDALEEIIEIGRVTGMPVQVSHIKLAMKRLWGQADRVLDRLDRARARGVDISADIYPYEYWQSDMMVMLPGRDPDDRQAVEQALEQIAPPDGIWFTAFPAQPGYVGQSLAQVAGQRGTDAATAFSELLHASQAWKARTGEPGDAIIGTSMLASDIAKLMAWPHANLCTDGALVDLHPRARGSYPRVLGRYVREQGLLGLEQAVHKMTGLAAQHMGFRDRGIIRPGAAADLVLFDPASVIDHATPTTPEALSSGILAVWVNGQKVYDGGGSTGARPGKVLRRQAP